MSRVSWQRTIDQIILSGSGRNSRIVGLTSIRRHSGVTLISRYLAKTLAAHALRVLLIDLSKAVSIATDEIDATPDGGWIRQNIEASGNGYDLLDIGGDAFIDLPQLKLLLTDELSEYERIVIDLPPVLNAAVTGINTVAVGAECDRLMLITRLGRDKRAELTSVVSFFREAGVQPAAILSNKFK